MRLSEPAPVDMINGIAPIIVDKAVISTGRRRRSQASINASPNSLPSSRNWFANSTIRIPFLLAIPTSTISPILLYRFRLPSVRKRPSSAPNIASGTVVIITIGCTKLSNCAAKTRNTISSASPKINARPPPDSFRSKDSPL